MKALSKIQILIGMITFLVISNQSVAQQVPLYNHYFANKFLNYGSAAGDNDLPGMSLIYRAQSTNLEGAPATLLVNYTSGLRGRMGYGGTIHNYSIGLINQNKISAGASYLLIDKNYHALSFGALSSYSHFSLNEDVLNPETLEDPVLLNLLGNGGSSLSFDFSLTYRFGEEVRFDFAAPGLINVSLSDDDFSKINDDTTPDYILGFQYRFALDPVNGIYIKPALAWRSRETIGGELDGLVQLDYKSLLSLSAGYRSNYGPTMGLGLRLTPNLRFNFNHDFGQPDVPFLSDGVNEIALHVSFKKRADKMFEKQKAGAAILADLRKKGVYDRELIPDEDEELVEEFLYSRTQKGNKKGRRKRAKEKFNEALESIKTDGIAKLEQERRAQLRTEENTRKEKARVETERKEEEAKVEADRIESEQREIALEKTKQDSVETEKETPELEKETPELEKEISETQNGSEITDSSIVKDLETIQYKYVIIVSSYSINNNWGPIYLKKMREEYPEAALFRSLKRSRDYLYILGYNDYDTAIEKMREVRATTDFKSAWVHIIRLSR